VLVDSPDMLLARRQGNLGLPPGRDGGLHVPRVGPPLLFHLHRKTGAIEGLKRLAGA
jgi:hypothetical protein